MLEYDLGIQDDNKEAVASVVDKLFGRHIFQTLRTQMQVQINFHLPPFFCRFHSVLLCSSATSRRAGTAHTSRSSALSSQRRPHLRAAVAYCVMVTTRSLTCSQIGYQRVLVQSSLHSPSHVAERVLDAADVFAKELMEMPESAITETAQAFANKMREPDQSVYVKSERVADEVRMFCAAP